MRLREQRHLAVQWLLLAVLWIVGITLSYWTSSQPGRPLGSLGPAAGFTAAFLAARLLSVRLPQGDEVHAALMVAVVGLVLLPGPWLVLASLTAGTVDAVVRFTHSAKCQFSERLIDTVRSSAVVGLVTPWQVLARPLISSPAPGDAIILWALTAGIVFAALDVMTTAAQQSIRGGLPFTQSIVSLLRPIGTVYAVHIPMSAVVLRLYTDTGTWPFPVALLLTLILQNSFNLYLRIRRAYAETISALAHAAELDRPHDSGHARRVADLSVSVGRRIGLSSRELERIGYAALLHDIGRMGAFPDTADGTHARRGAEIAGSIPFLNDVAPLISWQDHQDSPPVGWTIVRMCSKYDRLRADLGAHAALEELSGQESSDCALVFGALADLVHSDLRRLETQ